MLSTYVVRVCNEQTGDERIVEVESGHSADAQVEALRCMFRSEGWRKARALVPERLEERVSA